MPYPSQISEETIIATALEMIETDGVDRFSLNKLAKALGVKTPSLYRYFKNKNDILRAINVQTTQGVFKALQVGLDAEGDVFSKLVIASRSYRTFALDNPLIYDLAYTNTIPELNPDDSERTPPVLPYQTLMAELSGEADSLPALRGLLALMHGFVMLELANQYQRGGNLSDAYEKSIRAYLRGWDRQ